MNFFSTLFSLVLVLSLTSGGLLTNKNETKNDRKKISTGISSVMLVRNARMIVFEPGEVTGINVVERRITKKKSAKKRKTRLSKAKRTTTPANN